MDNLKKKGLFMCQDLGPFMGTEEVEMIHNTSKELVRTKDELQSTHSQLAEACIKLKEKERELERSSFNLQEAYASLERAQRQLNAMRYVKIAGFFCIHPNFFKLNTKK